MIRNPKKVYLRYILPAIGGMMGTSLYVLGDTMLVGRRLGTDGLAALNISIPMINVLTGLGLLIGMGGASLMSIRLAREEYEEGNKLFTKSMLMSIITGLILLFLSIFFTKNLVDFLGRGSENLGMAYDYLSMLMMFSPFFLVFISLTVFVRNDGGSKIAMAAMLAASVFNVVMDYVFLFPLDVGMRGCALATGLAQVVGFSVLLLHFREAGIKILKLSSFKAPLEIIKNGMASFVLELSQGIVIFAFNFAFLRIDGDIAVSAYGIVANLSLLFTAILAGVANGIQPLISEAYGRRLSDMKVYYGKIAAIGGLVIGFGILLIGQLVPKYLAMIFVENEPELINRAILGIRIYFLAFPITGLNLVATIFLQSQKRSMEAFIMSLMRGFVWILTLLLILSNTLGIIGVWLVIPLAELLSLGIGLMMIRKITRQKVLKPVRA